MLLKLLLLVVLMVGTVFAQESSHELSEFAYTNLLKAKRFMEENRSKEALELLEYLHNTPKVETRFDKANIDFFMGYLFTQQRNTIKAKESYKKALSYHILPLDMQKSAYRNLVYICIKTEEYTEAMAYLHTLLQRDSGSKEEWLKLKLYIHYRLDEYAEATEVLKKLISYKPESKAYWLELSALYEREDKFSKSLASLDSAYLSNLALKDNEIIRLSSWLAYSGAPYRGAQLLERAIEDGRVSKDEKHLNRLGEIYALAQELDKAIEVFESLTGTYPSAKAYYALGKLYCTKRMYKKAIEALQKALECNKERGMKYLWLGKCYYKQHHINKAKEAFSKALLDENTHTLAKEWLEYIN